MAKWKYIFGAFSPLTISSLWLSQNIWKKSRLAINGNKSVLQPRQYIRSVCKQIYMFVPARWISSVLHAAAQLYKPCLSNQSCVCTRELNPAGTVLWCWDQGRWKQCIHISDLLSPCSAHKLPVESGPSPCQLLACAWELFGKVGPGSVVPGTALTIKLPSSAWERSPELFHLPGWASALDSSFGRFSLASPWL